MSRFMLSMALVLAFFHGLMSAVEPPPSARLMQAMTAGEPAALLRHGPYKTFGMALKKHKELLGYGVPSHIVHDSRGYWVIED